MSTEQEAGDSAAPIEKQSEMEYAGFWIRLLAWLIDLLPLGMGGGVISVIYFVGLWTWRGQTLGQIVVKVKVVRTDGEPVDLRTAVLRFLGYWVCYLTLGIGFLMIAWDDRKQGLHDKIAKTYVVPSREE